MVAASQLVHFSPMLPSNRRLPELRCLELFFSQNITDVRFELGHRIFTPVGIHVHRIDYLGCPGVACRHCRSVTHLGSLQTTIISILHLLPLKDTLVLYALPFSTPERASFLFLPLSLHDQVCGSYPSSSNFGHLASECACRLRDRSSDCLPSWLQERRADDFKRG